MLTNPDTEISKLFKIGEEQHKEWKTDAYGGDEGVIVVKDPNQPPSLLVVKNANTQNDEIVYGSTGDDKLDGSNLLSLDLGVSGNSIFTGSGNDKIFGDSGNDEINGDSGDDTLIGGAGNDTLIGGNGVFGDSGNDFLDGGDGNDSITGGAQDDTLIGGIGKDTLSGGFDSDTFVIRRNEGIRIKDGASREELKNGIDLITDFGTSGFLGTDKIKLIDLSFGDLDFQELIPPFNIFNPFAKDTAIKIRLTGEYLAFLEGVSKDSINKNEFFI